LTIADSTNRQVRRLDLPKTTGLHRATWNLRADPAAPEGRGAGGRGGAAPGAAGGGEPAADPQPPGGGRGGQQGPLVVPGRYRATLGRQVGDTVTPIGSAQSFQVVPLPK
jgi:hypothetical protein